MHEAKMSRARVDADNIRTEDSICRAAISSASYEGTSRLLVRGRQTAAGEARAPLLEHSAAPGQSRAALSEC